MTSSSLYPPNIHLLGDAVIGGVVQRGLPSLSRYGSIAERSDAIEPMQSDHVNQADANASQSSFELIADVLSTTDKSQVTGSSAGKKRQTLLDDVPDAHQQSRKRWYSCISLTQTDEHNEPRRPKNRRERCRINQARYRTRQRKHAVDLEEGISQLRNDIYKLEVKRQIVVRSGPTNETIWNVATEYFRLFQYGYIVPVIATESSPRSTAGMPSTPQSHAQLDFLKATMTLDVTDGMLCGAEAILDYWRLLSLYHQDVHVQLKRLQKGPGNSVIATTRTSLTLTENTLRYAYRHLAVNGDCHNDENFEWSTLGAKLINKRLVLCGSVRFDWDEANGRVVRMESSADMLTPMLRLFGCLKDVARVFDGARITPDCTFTVL